MPRHEELNVFRITAAGHGHRYWVHDTSPGCARTYQLIDRTVPLADRLIRMSRLPVLRSTLTDVLSIVDDMRA